MMATFNSPGGTPSSGIPIPSSSASNFPAAFSLSIDTSHTNIAASYDSHASHASNSLMAKNSPAFETAVDSYATRTLQSQCPPQVKMEPSVGPYVTSVIRSSLQELQSEEQALGGSSDGGGGGTVHVTLLSQYESLVELLEEHCSMTPDVAQSALTKIVSAMQTGVFSDQYPFSSSYQSVGSFGSSSGLGSLHGFGGGMNGMNRNRNRIHMNRNHSNGSSVVGGSRLGRYRSKSMGAESDYNDFESIQALGDMLHRSNLSQTVNISTSSMNSSQKEYQYHVNSHNHSNSAISPSPNELGSSSIFPSWGSNLDLGGGSAPHHDEIEPIKEEPSCIEDDEPSFFMEEDVVPEKTPSKSSNSNFQNHTPRGMDTGMDPSITRINHSSPVASSIDETGNIFLVSPAAPAFTPLKPDRLIPVDLLGLIDDPSTPSGGLEQLMEGRRNMTIPVLGVAEQGSHDLSTITKVTECHTPEPTPASEPITATSTPNTVASTGTSSTAPTVPTTAASSIQSTAISTVTNSGKSKKKMSKNNDLAATLFSRPRSKSLCHNEKSPKLKPLAAPHASVIGMSGLSKCSASAVMNNSIPALFQKQLDSAVQILLAMNYDICEEAAYEAAMVSNADVNVAQHVIDGAVSAPPVCRHLMNGGCYRSDCHYSHDIDGHTCLFWLRGRCNPNRKGEACRFMHGFSEKLLEGVNLDYNRNIDGKADSASFHSRDASMSGVLTTGAETASKPIPIKTSNLVQHNMMSCFSNPKEGHPRSFTSPTEDSIATSPGGSPMFIQTSVSMPSKTGSFLKPRGIDSGELLPPANSQNIPRRLDPSQAAASISNKGKNNGNAFSFASIASKGYKEKSSFHKSTSPTGSGVEHALLSAGTNTSKAMKSVRIPQDLWTASFNRSSSAFHITDPLSRYKEVSASVHRHDVIDLHFQSVKSFPIVLEAVLPEKLRDHGEVWIVTGSGHHVNRTSHQKGGGVLENSLIGWLTTNDYEITKGRDKNGHGGAVLVHGKHR